MKNFIIVLLVICAGAYFWKHQQAKQADSPAPVTITNPVYAEARVKWEGQGRTVEGVMLAKTVDQADCERTIRTLENDLQQQTHNVCPACKIQPPICESDLAPRYVKLFDNQPASLTYLSIASADGSGREMRLIYWGVSVEESDRLCGVVSQLQKGHKGTVSCVRAAR